MKQVYTQQNENQPPSVRSHVKAWVLFFGFLVWLLAVKETFGQAANSSANKANTQITGLTPLSGACTINASATLQYRVDKGNNKYYVLMQDQTVIFRLKNARGVLTTAQGTTDAQGVATAQLAVPAGATAIEAEFAGTDLYKKEILESPFTVEDKTAPVVDARSSVSLALDESGRASLRVADVLNAPSSDACGIRSEVLSRTAFDCAGKGTHTVTLTVTDINNNVTVRQIAVTVADHNAPVPSVANLPVLTGECSVSATAPRALDNCAGLLTATTAQPLEYNQQGAYTITWRYNDGNGNVTEQQQQVLVQDVTNPVISNLPADLIVAAGANCQAVVSWIAPTAADNCELASLTADVAPGTTFGLGTRKVTYTATDKAGNVSKASFLVTVEDNTAPAVVVQNATIYLDAEGKATLPLDAVRVSSTDNCGILAEVLSQGHFSCEHVGVNTVTLTVTDVNGNVNTSQASVTVEDKIAPVIAGMPANLELAAGANCRAIGSWVAPSFSDNCAIKGFTVTHPVGTAFELGVTTVTYTVEDHAGNTQQASFTVTVTNAAPQLTQIVAPTAPVAVIHAVPVTLAFADDNLTGASIEWGDGSSANYAPGPGSNTLAAGHTYAAPGLYALKVTLTDACGAQAAGTYEYVMVNNPTDGFITGGGWINSPAGALAGTTFAGKASYGFNAKYNPATGVSSGSATFDFPAGALSFASNRIEWLVVADAKAWIKGTGTVNGVSGYSFQLSAVDSELNGYRNMDTFRMQIWDQNGALVYDNQRNAARNAPAGQMIAGGSIVVHKTKEAAPVASSNRMGAEAGGQVSLGLKAYPNPSADHFTITANENLTADAQVTVLDLRGQPVYRGMLRANEGRTLEVNLTTRGAGVYVVQVNVNGRREVLKLVKQ